MNNAIDAYAVCIFGHFQQKITTFGYNCGQFGVNST